MFRSLAPVAAVIALTLCACGLPVTQGPAQNGTLCTSADQCASGQCVDGVCCESACEGGCVSCAVPGSEGTCANVPDGEDPRDACGQGACGGACDGAGACRYPGAETTCGDKVCAGDSIQQAACDGAGQCSFTTTPCAPYACEAGACLTSCADPLDCAVTGRCLPDGTCESKLPAGSDCASGAACASGYCADGVCCDKPCAGTCEACNLAASRGTCTFIPAGEDPSVECPGDAPCGSSCDGQGACAYAAAGVACGSPTCSTPDAPLLTKQCNGAGACLDSSSSCGDYACIGNGCRTTCGSSTDCRVTAFCSGGQCLPKRNLGDACANADECLSGHCVDGVCCSSACGDACDSCADGTPGLCTPLGAGGTPQMSCGTGQACGQTTSCPGACSATSPCAAGYYCDTGSGLCQLQRAVGVACTQDRECGSGFCDDGVCCATDCSNTPCRSCNQSQQTAGQCLPLPWGTAAPQCPGSYACRADGQCAVGACADDQDCKPGAFCAGTAGCQVQKTNGQTCARGRECASGFCVDGVCCNSDCAGTCRACNLPGAAGACTNVVPGTDPFAECGGGFACGSGGMCNATCTSNANCEAGFVCQSGVCVAGKPLGQACTSGAECVSGNCVDGVCCNTACGGACSACDVPNSLGLCSPLPANTDEVPADCSGGYTCNGAGACRTSCTSNAQCKPGYGCKNSTCVLLAPNGATCAAGADCQSGFCADGVCCNSSCGQKCEACNVPGQVGACVPFAPKTDPQNECGANTCNGQSACGSTCTLDQDCALGNYCNAGACAVKKPLGATCSANNQCSGGLCVDGVCCNDACTGACRSCVNPNSVGTCTSVPAGQDYYGECAGGLACGGNGCNTACTGAGDCEGNYWCDTATSTCMPDLVQGQACTLGSQCPGDRCVDGVCCDSACAGACDACNVNGSVGTCTLLSPGSVGAPSCSPYVCNGLQASCPTTCSNAAQTGCAPGNYCTPANACAPKKTNGTTCTQGYECGSGNCVDGVCCDTSCGGSCDACNLPGSVGTCSLRPVGSTGSPSCAPYLCNGAQASCPNTCVNATQLGCAATHYCDTSNACQPKKANATACSANYECGSGNCVDGVCCNSACVGGCNRCDAPGSVGTCTLLPAGASGHPAGTCDPYVCSGASASCPTACTTQSQCANGFFCNTSNNTCQPKKANATACSSNVECQSAQCVDGVCCNSSCTGSCRACDLPGTVGTCTNVPAASDPDAECGNNYCNGAGACSSGCTSNSQCKSGFCADGVCCNAACTGNCRACDLSGTVGTCSFIPSGTDPDDECNGSSDCNGSGGCN